jgi:hypothetical protein
VSTPKDEKEFMMLATVAAIATADHHEQRIYELEQENAALRELTSTLGAPNHINIPVEKWRELRADKERLDWLESLHSLWEGTEKTGPVFLTRAAIDAARKEAQPWGNDQIMRQHLSEGGTPT